MLAPRRKQVDGYLLKQSSKPAKKNKQAGLFKKLFFFLDRDAGLLLYFSSQPQATGGTPPKGSIPLVGIEFVEALAKERPAPILLHTEKKDKKDKHNDGDELAKRVTGWQWPFVVHTVSQGTHLILAPTTEVRDTWVVNLDEAIAEAKLRERKLKSKSEKINAPNLGRERSESEVQADFLDILVFDSYVHELRKKEKTDEPTTNNTSPRFAFHHPTPPLSPLNTPPPTTKAVSPARSPRMAESPSTKSAASPNEAWLTIQSMLQKESDSEKQQQQQRAEAQKLTSSGSPPASPPRSSGSEGGSPDASKGKGSRSQTVWRKEERHGGPDGAGVKRRIGVRERTEGGGVDTTSSGSVATTAAARSVVVPVRKSTSEETVTCVKPTEKNGNESESESEGEKSENQSHSEEKRAKGESPVPKRLSAGKRVYHTVRAPSALRKDEHHPESGLFGLSLHRRNLSMDLHTLVRTASQQAEAEASARGADVSKAEDESAVEDEQPVQLRDRAVLRRPSAIRPLTEAASQGLTRPTSPAGADEDEDDLGSEFFHQMQRRLSVIYQRMNDMEGDFLAHHHRQQSPSPESVDGLSSVSTDGSPRAGQKKAGAGAGLGLGLGKEDRQAVRADQEMLQAVVRREVVCRRLHRLVDNPLDHDVQFLVSRDTSNRQVIYGHRALIRTRSSFFDKLFSQATNSGMDPKGPYMIPDTTRDAFIEVLSYLYSGSLGLTVDNVQEVYKVAATIRMRELKAACRQFATRQAIDLPPRPTSVPYHVAKRQSVLDLFKNVNFEEARRAALATTPGEGEEEANKTDTSSYQPADNSEGFGEDGSKGKAKAKRMSQGVARVKNVLALVSPRGSQVLSQDDKPEQPASPTSSSPFGGGNERDQEKVHTGRGDSSGSLRTRKEEVVVSGANVGSVGGSSSRNSNNEKEEMKKNEKESGGREEKEKEEDKKLSGGVRGSFFSRSVVLSKSKRTTRDNLTQHQ